MPRYKCNRSAKKKLSSELVKLISGLKKENVLLKKTLAEMCYHQGEHIKLVERLLALETLRLESCQQIPAKDETASSSEDVCTKEKNSLDGDSPSKEQVSSGDEAVFHLQNKLHDALEKNKQWLEYDQQREAYVRAILDKMLWLEKQLNEANQTHSKQHNEEHSDEEARTQIKERYESLLKEVDVWLDTLRKQVEVTHQELITAIKGLKKIEKELEALTNQLKSEIIEKGTPQEECHNSEEEEQQLREETKELQAMLKEEKRRSTNFELQASIYQRYMLNHHHADQEKIADLERQIKISAQDLEDAKRDSSYLKKQMLRIVKKLPKAKGLYPEQSKRDQQYLSFCEEVIPSSSSPRDSLAPSANSILNESVLECPICQTIYPTNQYSELLKHLDTCVE